MQRTLLEALIHKSLLFACKDLCPLSSLWKNVTGTNQILNELWTRETDVPQVKTNYLYVFELREQLDKEKQEVV